jgi:4-aminobutyrate aminotransferase-like enzyme
MNSRTIEAIERRRHVLGPTYSLFYQQPLQMVRAEGVWMFDADGCSYLDAYNNVPAVGHCHPRVVEALARQAGMLNTHTRYLIEQPALLAERLLATMPHEIGNVVFACTGSEANDLATRICKTVTGGTGFIVTGWAYHGTSETTAGMSPSGRAPKGRDVYYVPAPLGSDGPARFAADVGTCIELMREDGVKPAALLVDTVFSSDGLVTDPCGFLVDAAREIRAAGGLFIADEVQPGFGRMGEGMWGFARHGVVPDIVTMGKPMGNGHPIAALAARPELMEAFSKHVRYFNTYGGNSVSCAVALAVLDVIEDEGLIENARTVGAHLRSGLERLAEKHSAIGAIRGTGLYYGVDIGQGDAASAAEMTTRVVNRMRDEGVLIGATGRNESTLKIRPPLPFNRDNADVFLAALDKALA